MYKIAICEDDKKYAEALKKLMIDTGVIDEKLLHFQVFSSGEKLCFYPQLEFDMIIMDVQLSKMNGYEAAMELRKIDNNFLLVFCSGVIMPAPKFFRANAFRYLDKNASREELLEDMTSIMKEMIVRKVRPYIMCKYSLGKEQIRVYSEAVLYITIRGSGCQVYLYGKLKESFPETLRVNMNLNSVVEIFDEKQGFVRIHNSYIVNMVYIIKIGIDSITLIDGTELNVARSKMKHFRQVFARFMASKYEG